MKIFRSLLYVGALLFFLNSSAFADPTCQVGDFLLKDGQTYQKLDKNICKCNVRGGMGKVECEKKLFPDRAELKGCRLDSQPRAGHLKEYTEIYIPEGLKMASATGRRACECSNGKLNCEDNPSDATENKSFSACLKSLNENSAALKGKITVIDDTSYLVKDDEGAVNYISEAGSYKLQSKPAKCSPREDIIPSDLVKSLYIKGTSPDVNPQTSGAMKDVIRRDCQGFTGSSASTSPARSKDGEAVQ
jgi:hypothetical protein